MGVTHEKACIDSLHIRMLGILEYNKMWPSRMKCTCLPTDNTIKGFMEKQAVSNLCRGTWFDY